MVKTSESSYTSMHLWSFARTFAVHICIILTFQRTMEYSIKRHDRPLYIFRGHRLYIFFKCCIFSLNINFVLANSADPDEMVHCAALLKYVHKVQVNRLV